MRRWWWLAIPVIVAVGVVLAISLGHSHSAAPRSSLGQVTDHPAPQPTGTASRRPNIVFILTDDLTFDLLPFMPHVEALVRHGVSFKDYFVSDSLCCPSRASIFTGELPHDTGVYTNGGVDGGFAVFHDRLEEQHTFAVALQAAGYRTALMGKYLNRYMQSKAAPTTYVPPGWSAWDVAGWGYPEYRYVLNQDGVLHYYGRRPGDYLTDVLSRDGASFIDSSARQKRPFFLELSTFAPHLPSVPAPGDAADFPNLTAPRPPSFDRLPRNAPLWLAGRRPLTPRQLAAINLAYLRRAQSVLAVDRMLGHIERQLAASGLAHNTYLVFSSDNGYHTGEYRLTPGKLTAFDPDIRVPLIVAGPGVRRGVSSHAMAENIDLAETFADIGGAALPADGHSLLPLLQRATPRHWRNAVLVEHHGSDLTGADPDLQQPAAGSPRTYEAMRTPQFLYVEYNDGEREFYDLRHDPFELDNLARRLAPRARRRLHAELVALERCHGGGCWAAMHVRGSLPRLLASARSARRSSLARGALRLSPTPRASCRRRARAGRAGCAATGGGRQRR
jgi:arylsulfatase A-like enzyme